jgi:predicted RNA-binding Zn ribbon-like protein
MTTQWLAAPAETLCLDFANTRYWRGSLSPTEELGASDALLAWYAEKAAIPAPHIDQLRQRWQADADEAAAAFAAVLALREAIYRLFHAVAAKGKAPEAELRALNAALADAPVRRVIEPGPGGGFGWRVEADGLDPLTPMLWSAADLLVSRRLGRVKLCANEECLYLFLDDSKSANRRWCSMSACGNRAKVRRFNERKRKLAFKRS